MPVVRAIVQLVAFLITVLQANLQAAPIPFQPYGEVSSTEVVLQLARLNDYSWAADLAQIQALELSGTKEYLLSAFEALIHQYTDDERAIELLIPLYWFQSEISGHTLHRPLFLNSLANKFDSLLLLTNVDMLLQWHELSQTVTTNEQHNRAAQEIRLQYDQLQSLPDQPEHNLAIQLWAKALLYFYRPGGGLKVADDWLQSQAKSIDNPEIIIVYRKLFHDLAGQPFPSLTPDCWPLTCASAMTTDEMAHRAQRAYKLFSNDGFGQAWQYLQAGVYCLYNAQSNPVIHSFSLCLSYFNNLNGILAILRDSTAAGHSEGWREYWLIKNTYDETLNFQNRVSNQVQYAYRNEEERISRIEDPETRLQESQKLLNSPLSGFASSHGIQQTRQSNERQLQAIRDEKKKQAAIDQAYERFQTNLRNLGQLIDNDPNNENLWEKLQSLADSEDARAALEPSTREALNEKARSGLTDVRENNRLSRLYKEQQTIKKGYLAQVEVLDQQREQTGDDKAWLTGFIALLGSEAGKYFSETERAEKREKARKLLAELEPLTGTQLSDQNSLFFSALETIGRGEDPLTQGIEKTAENLVRISYKHFPEGTEQVLNALSHVDNTISAVVEFIDDSTGNRGSAVWQQLDETTQVRILGAGKVLSVLVPAARVKAFSLFFSALETIGRGEDPLTQGIEKTAENLVRISYKHFPEGTEQVLNALSHVDNTISAVVEFIDDSTGNRGSAVWQQLDETTQVRILGAGKVLSVLVPVARVKALAELVRVPSPALKQDGWHPDSVEARHKKWQEHYGGREDHEYQGISGYVPAPENLRAFPEAALSDRKTLVQGGGELRKRWKDKKGNIYEWDSRHGRIEKYDKRGSHLGEFDPENSQQLSKPDRSRRVEP